MPSKAGRRGSICSLVNVETCSHLTHTHCPSIPPVRLRARMQSRSSRAKPWLAKSPSVFTPPAPSFRAASASDRSQLTADILNEDRVALAARLRDPGDDPPPYYRDSSAVEDEPCGPPKTASSTICANFTFSSRLNVSRQALGVKPTYSRDSIVDASHVIGVSEPEEWREISTLQTVTLSATLHIYVPLTMCLRNGLEHASR